MGAESTRCAALCSSLPSGRQGLRHVQQALAQVDEGLDTGLPSDLVAVDLRDALYHLGTITGEVSSDEVLGNIFSRFCIGK